MTATISFDAFCRDNEFLAPWFKSEGREWRDGCETFTAPREAAAFAAYTATVQHRGKRGRIEVLAADQGRARECRDYLVAYFTDQPMLAAMVKRTTPDGVELRGGTIIEASANDKRRSRDALCSVLLTLEPEITVEEMDGLDVSRKLYHLAFTHSKRAEALSEKLGLDLVAMAERCQAECRARPTGAQVGLSSTAAPHADKLPPAAQPSPMLSRVSYIVSHGFEVKRAERMGSQPPPIQQRAVLSGARRWR